METVGFIGVGNMGKPMSSRLIERGYQLVVYDIKSEATKLLVDMGAMRAVSPKDVTEKAGIVLMSLPSQQIVEEVALGPDGIIHGAGDNTIVVEMSTSGPKTVEQIDKVFKEKGIKFLDAPVSGGVVGAERGSLAVMAAGAEAVFEKCRDILGIIGKNVFYVGAKPGLGQAMKLINNILSYTALVASSEAMVLAVKAGLDPGKAIEVLNVSSGRNSATQDKFPLYMLPRTFDGGFSTELVYKDACLALEMAESYGVPMFACNAVKQMWGYALCRGGGKDDFTRIINYIEEWAGVQVKGKGIN